MECWAHVKSHFCAAEMLVTDEGEIQLWGKTQLILLRSQADAGFNLHQSLALCPSISHLKTNRLTHPPSLRVSILTPLSPPAATSFFCSFFTGNVLKVLSVVTTLNGRPSTPLGQLLARSPTHPVTTSCCPLLLLCPYLLWCLSSPQLSLPLPFTWNGFLSWLPLQTSPLLGFILPFGLPSQSPFLAPTLSLNF